MVGVIVRAKTQTPSRQLSQGLKAPAGFQWLWAKMENALLFLPVTPAYLLLELEYESVFFIIARVLPIHECAVSRSFA